MQNTDFLLETELFIRIILALVCGAVIGYERNNRGKGAGLRTHSIVAIASCLMMIISQYGFDSFFAAFDNPEVKLSLDPARIAAQIVSGIGFLGAGMIFIQKNVVTGLTTAAGIWATAGIGMAIGCGMYFLGIVCTALIVIVQMFSHKYSKFLHYTSDAEIKIVVQKAIDVEGVLSKIQEVGIIVSEVECSKRDDDKIDVNILVQSYDKIERKVLLEKLCEEKGVISVKM